MNQYLKWKEDTRRQQEMSKIRRKCSCSHSVIIPVWIDKKVCSYCGRLVYKDDETKFKYKLFYAIRKIEKGNQ